MKYFTFSLMLVLFIMVGGGRLCAADSYDTSKTSSGILTVKTDASVSSKTIKLQVLNTADSKTYYTYTITTNSAFTVPLQMGNGTYKATLLENTTGNNYKQLSSETFTVKITDSTAMYLYSSPIVNFSSSMTSIKAFTKLMSGGSSDKMTAAYNELVNNYTYDTAKASSVSSDYVPVLDTFYNNKKGICYDYSAMLAGALRANGVPTRLCMGYAPDINVYHAWNQVYIDGSWITLDCTYDAAYVQAGKSVTMKKDSSKFQVVKTY